MFDEGEVIALLRSVPAMHRAAFVASCAERLFPNYVAFSRETGWGKPRLLREALDAVWDHLCGKTLSSLDAKAFISKVDKAIPDTEDFQTVLVSFALDAGVAIVEALKSCFDGDVQHGLDAAVSATDTVDMYIQESENLQLAGSELEKYIAKHPLMVRELQKQESDLEKLRNSPSLDLKLIAELRVSNGGRSNIGIL